jgi:hypothetical protein
VDGYLKFNMLNGIILIDFGFVNYYVNIQGFVAHNLFDAFSDTQKYILVLSESHM